MNNQDWKNHPILTRDDGSYVITHIGNPYHVPNSGEFAELWQAVHTFAQDNQQQVQPEPLPPPPPPPTQEALAALRVAAIKARLNELDLESIRPLRAVVDGTADPEDTERLAEINAEIGPLREELRGLEPEAGEAAK